MLCGCLLYITLAICAAEVEVKTMPRFWSWKAETVASEYKRWSRQNDD